MIVRRDIRILDNVLKKTVPSAPTVLKVKNRWPVLYCYRLIHIKYYVN
jgi:hypothetical protein